MFNGSNLPILRIKRNKGDGDGSVKVQSPSQSYESLSLTNKKCTKIVILVKIFMFFLANLGYDKRNLFISV